MGILDKLKVQPRWKHADPAVRLEAIEALDDPSELAALAEHDPDARVRRAAVAKTGDPAVLGRIVAADADAGVRDAAGDRLLALALEAALGDAMTAVSLLSDVRRVSTLAKSAAPDAVRTAALEKLSDQRALGGVARHAKVESTALAAAARLTSPEELLSTALNSEHRDVALAAFERVASAGATAGADTALLESVAARTQQKAVARRAKAMLQEIEDAANAEREAEAERRRQEASLSAAVEALRDATDPERAAAELGRLTAAWEALTDATPDAARRFAAGADAARTRIAERRSELEAARAAERRRDEALAPRIALHQRVLELVAGDDLLERAAALETEWAALPPLVEYEREAADVAARFAAAVRACRDRHARADELREARTKLDALVVEAEGLAPEGDEAAPGRWRTLAREARALVAMLGEAAEPIGDLGDRLAAVARVFEAQQQAARDAEAKARRVLVTKLGRLAERAKRAAAAETLTLREGDRLLRDLGTALDEAGSGGAKEVREAVTALRTLQEQLAPRVKELRDMDDWRRFANVQQQEELIVMAEAIVASLKAEEEAGTDTDLAATAHALRELHTRWREGADVPHHLSRKLWDRFKAATDFIRTRCEVHFVKVREERTANLAAKRAIVEEAESLAGSTDWNKSSARFQALQKAWEETGPAEREGGRALAQRFRAACNAFFSERRGALTSLKKEWDENLARKVALCERAEALAASSDWDATASELKKLQAEWKTIGPVGNKQREAIWNRFRTAADGFFARYHDRHNLAAAAEVAEHAGVAASLEALGALDEAPEDLGAQVQALRTSFGALPRVANDAMRAVNERWRVALAALVGRWPAAFAGTDLDAAAIQARLEKLLVKVERLLENEEPAAPARGSDTASLADRLRSALAQNAMGVRPDESKWRAARKAVEEAEDAWRRLAVVETDETRALATKFKSACARVMEQVKRHVRFTGNEGDEGRGGRGRREGRDGRGRRGGDRPPRGGDRPPRGADAGGPGGRGRPTGARQR